MVALRLERRGALEELVLAVAIERHDALHFGPAGRDRAGLVERDRAQARGRFEERAALY